MYQTTSFSLIAAQCYFLVNCTPGSLPWCKTTHFPNLPFNTYLICHIQHPRGFCKYVGLDFLFASLTLNKECDLCVRLSLLYHVPIANNFCMSLYNHHAPSKTTLKGLVLRQVIVISIVYIEVGCNKYLVILEG